MRRRLGKGFALRVLRVAEVTDLTPESTDEEILRKVYEAAWLCQGLDIWNRAIVYAELVDFFDHLTGVSRLPYVAEDLFFDQLTLELVHAEREAEPEREEPAAIAVSRKKRRKRDGDTGD